MYHVLASLHGLDVGGPVRHEHDVRAVSAYVRAAARTHGVVELVARFACRALDPSAMLAAETLRQASDRAGVLVARARSRLLLGAVIGATSERLAAILMSYRRALRQEYLAQTFLTLGADQRAHRAELRGCRSARLYSLVHLVEQLLHRHVGSCRSHIVRLKVRFKDGLQVRLESLQRRRYSQVVALRIGYCLLGVATEALQAVEMVPNDLIFSFVSELGVRVSRLNLLHIAVR